MRTRSEIEAEVESLADGGSNDDEISGLQAIVDELLDERDTMITVEELVQIDLELSILNRVWGEMPFSGTYNSGQRAERGDSRLWQLHVLRANLECLRDGLKSHSEHHQALGHEVQELRSQRAAVRKFLGLPE